MTPKETILILDFGSQHTQLIAQRVRENYVFSQVVPFNIPVKTIKLIKPKGLILSGGANAFYQKGKLSLKEDIFKLDIPILGIAYGARLIVQSFGGRVKPAKSAEPQRRELFIDDARNLFSQMPGNITALVSLGDNISKLPSGFMRTAHAQDNFTAAFECPKKKIFGVTFHPEATTTQRGSQILNNFLYKICRCKGNWTTDYFIKEVIAETKKTVGKSRVILNLDGELSSSVAAILLHRAIGSRFKCIFIESGLLRLEETKQIRKVLQGDLRINLNYLDKRKLFLQSLKNIEQTEEKTKIVRNLFARLIEEEIKKSKRIEFFASGTLYSDIINPATAASVNRAGLRPQGQFLSQALLAKLKVLSPLKDLFKEEIRVVAKELGLPDNIVFRQPCPSAGMCLRIIGEVTPARLKILQDADNCLLEAISNAGLYEQVWQAFAVLMPPKNTIALRCVASVDGASADWVRLPYELLDKIATGILKRIKEVNRVVYDISPKPPATIEWE